MNQNILKADIAILFRQFSTLIVSGIPIIQSLEILGSSQEKKSLQLLLQAIKKELLSGKNLSSSLRRHIKYFDELTCQLIKIGEQTGKLNIVLDHIASHQEKTLLLHRQIKQILFYPCFIFITALIMSCCLFIFVIPQFAEMFQDIKEPLPVLTQGIFNLACFLKQHILMIALLIIITTIGFIWQRHRLSQLKWLPKTQFQSLPFIAPYIKKIRLVQCARNLAMTLASGIPILSALTLTAQAANDAKLSEILTRLSRSVASGASLHHAMGTSAYFPILMIQMVKIGEESGMLCDMLDKMADFLEKEVNQITYQISKLLEPLIMMILGVLIGGLVIGMYLPIFKLGNLL